jgi:hypothetical protein
MTDEWRAMYDGFSDTGKHSTEWVRITKEFLKFAFAGRRREASCPCSRCETYFICFCLKDQKIKSVLEIIVHSVDIFCLK